MDEHNSKCYPQRMPLVEPSSANAKKGDMPPNRVTAEKKRVIDQYTRRARRKMIDSTVPNVAGSCNTPPNNLTSFPLKGNANMEYVTKLPEHEASNKTTTPSAASILPVAKVEFDRGQFTTSSRSLSVGKLPIEDLSKNQSKAKGRKQPRTILYPPIQQGPFIFRPPLSNFPSRASSSSSSRASSQSGSQASEHLASPRSPAFRKERCPYANSSSADSSEIPEEMEEELPQLSNKSFSKNNPSLKRKSSSSSSLYSTLLTSALGKSQPNSSDGMEDIPITPPQRDWNRHCEHESDPDIEEITLEEASVIPQSVLAQNGGRLRPKGGYLGWWWNGG